MKAVAIEQLPINLLFSSPISLAPLDQRSYSSVREPIRVLAVLIIFLVLLALSSRAVFSAIYLVNFSLSPASKA
jgi:hypothetical protein